MWINGYISIAPSTTRPGIKLWPHIQNMPSDSFLWSTESRESCWTFHSNWASQVNHMFSKLRISIVDSRKLSREELKPFESQFGEKRYSFCMYDWYRVQNDPISTRKLCTHRLITLQWRHNGHEGVSNHQLHDCLLNRLFRRRSKKPSKLRVTGFVSSASLAFVRGIHRWPVNSPHKWPVTRKMLPFDDVIMIPNKRHQQAMARLGVNSHKLEIELGRHSHPYIPRNERLCTSCKQKKLGMRSIFDDLWLSGPWKRPSFQINLPSS